jgi:hypothetical protein
MEAVRRSPAGLLLTIQLGWLYAYVISWVKKCISHNGMNLSSLFFTSGAGVQGAAFTTHFIH